MPNTGVIAFSPMAACPCCSSTTRHPPQRHRGNRLLVNPIRRVINHSVTGWAMEAFDTCSNMQSLVRFQLRKEVEIEVNETIPNVRSAFIELCQVSMNIRNCPMTTSSVEVGDNPAKRP